MITRFSAPGKVILFGEHFVIYGVKAILCAINKRVFVTAESIQEEKIIIKSEIGDLKLDKGVLDVDLPLKPIYFLADKMLHGQSKIKGIKVTIRSEIPIGAGLGSSSACCVAAAGAISGLFSIKSKKEILALAIEAEKTIFKDTSGADCTVSTFGGIIEYDKTGFSKIESNFQLVISNSNVKHSTEKIVGRVQEFKKENEKEFSDFCALESDLISDALELLKKNDIKKLGSLVVQNQKLLEKIGVSNDTLQKMIEIGDRSSYGSKITGAGDGGCIYSLTDETNASKTLDEFKSNYECFLAEIDLKGLDVF